MKHGRVVQRDHSMFTTAALSSTGGAPAAVTDGGGATHVRRASIRLLLGRAFVISPDGCVQIRPIWRLFGRRTRPHMPMTAWLLGDPAGYLTPGGTRHAGVIGPYC